jgi:hypothetical protein
MFHARSIEGSFYKGARDSEHPWYQEESVIHYFSIFYADIVLMQPPKHPNQLATVVDTLSNFTIQDLFSSSLLSSPLLSRI